MTPRTMSKPGTERVTVMMKTGSARTTQLQLLRSGLTAREAENIAAVAIGLRPAASGWSSREIERLQFLRYLRGSGRITP
jgi:hypothetical protein